MRKSLFIIIVLVTMLALVGCNEKKEEEKPNTTGIEMGQWIDTKQINQEDKKAYPVKFRVTSIEENPTKVEKEINDYNNSATGAIINLNEDERLIQVIANYEVEYPKEFPVADFGITKTSLDFKVVNKDKGDEITSDGVKFLGLNNTWEMGQAPMGYDFYSGDTYKGKLVFMVPKDYKDYLIKEYYVENDKEVAHFIKVK